MRFAVIAAVAALLIAACGDSPAEPTRESTPIACNPWPNYASSNGAWLFGGRLLRWREFPVRVAFDTTTLSFVTDSIPWTEGIPLGIRAWDVATQGKIGSTRFITSPDSADIVIRLAPFAGEDSDCFFLACLGETLEQSGGGFLVHATIVLYADAVQWSREKVAQITAHEMGHALGVLLHSESKADLMYFSELVVPTADEYPWITQRDLNTMAIAYCDK